MSLIFVGKQIERNDLPDIDGLPRDHVSMVVDIDRCIACHGCEVACFIENDLPLSVRVNPQIQLGTEVGKKFTFLNFSMRCAHCDNPQCRLICPVNAYKQDPDGFVIHNEERCIGCQLCRISCPYGAPKYDPERGRVVKCDFCIERVKKGQNPQCVSKCIMKALRFGRLGDQLEMLAKRASEGAGVLVMENKEPVIDPALSACSVQGNGRERKAS